VGQGPLAGYVSTLLKIQAAFEQGGIQFIDDDEIGGFGLRMAKKRRESGKRFGLHGTKGVRPRLAAVRPSG